MIPSRRLVLWFLPLLASLAGAQPAWAQRWTASLYVSDAGFDNPIEVRFGVWPGATDGIDGSLGEVEYPPFPPAGMREALFVGQGFGNGVRLDLRANTPGLEHRLMLAIQATGKGPYTVSWDAALIAAATTSARIQDTFGGVLFDVDMAVVDHVTVDDPFSIDRMRIIFVSGDLYQERFATALRFGEPMASAIVSGMPMPTVIVEAVDALGVVVDTHYRPIVLGNGSPRGTLTGTLQGAFVNGVARFDNLTYTADADGDRFVLTASSGMLGASHLVQADVRATRLACVAWPEPAYVGTPFAPPLVIAAVDDAGVPDHEYAGPVVLGLAQGAGRLIGETTALAVAGRVEFAVAYQTEVEEDRLVVAAEDASGLQPPLAPITQTVVLSTSVLRFSALPPAVMSGQPFAVPVVVTASRLGGAPVVGWADTVRLSLSLGNGVLRGPSVVVANQEGAQFAGLAYTAAHDGERFALQATSSSGSCRPAISDAVTADVVATHLAFAGRLGQVWEGSLTPLPSVVALDDEGQQDEDFAGTVTLAVALGGGTLGGTVSAVARGGKAEFREGVTYRRVDSETTFILTATCDVPALQPATVGVAVYVDAATAPGPTHPVADATMGVPSPYWSYWASATAPMPPYWNYWYWPTPAWTEGVPEALLAERGQVLVAGPSGDANRWILALAANTGRRLWEFPVAGGSGSLMVAGSTALVFGDGRLLAVSTADGSRRWSVPTGMPTEGSPQVVVGDGLAYAVGDTVYLRSVADGQLRWSLATGGGEVALEPAGDRLYVATTSHLRAISTLTGQEAWAVAADNPHPSLLASDDRVYTVSLGVGARPEVQALAAESGTMQWRSAAVSAPTDGVLRLLAADDQQVCGAVVTGRPSEPGAGGLFSLAVADGRLRWQLAQSLACRQAQLFQGTLYAALAPESGPITGGRIVAVGPDGQFRWQNDAPWGFTLAGGRAYMARWGANTLQVTVLDLRDGVELASVPAEGSCPCLFAVADGVVYAATSQSKVQALRLDTRSGFEGSRAASASAVAVPVGFALRGPYPNPANPNANLVLDLPEAADVGVELYDVLGQLVRRSDPVHLAPGYGLQVQVGVAGLASGTYLYRVIAITSARQWRSVGKMVVLR